MRSQAAWGGSQLWAVPASAGEFPVGAGARITGVDLRGYRQMRLVLQVGSPGGLAGATLTWRYSLDGGTTWADTYADIVLDGVGDQWHWGGWTDIPTALRQSVDVVLALFGSDGNGSTQVEVLSFSVNIRGLDQTSAARLLSPQVTPAEKLAFDEPELRSFSPADIADIKFAASPTPAVKTATTYTLALADNNRLVEIANASAITLTVPTNAAVAFPVGTRIEIAQTGAGQITVSGSAVTLRLPAGKQAKTRLQYSVIALIKRNTDEWILSGDLA